MFAVVAPVLRLPASLPSSFDYRIPEPLVAHVTRGSLVALPWRSLVVAGVVLEVHETSDVPATKVKDLVGLCVEQPLPTAVVDALLWIAEETVTSLPTVLKAFVPAVPKRVITAIKKSLGVLSTHTPTPLAIRSLRGGPPEPPPREIFLPVFVRTPTWEDALALVLREIAEIQGTKHSLLVLVPHRRDLAPLAEAVSSVITDTPVVVLDVAQNTGTRWRQFSGALSATGSHILLGTRSTVLFPDPTISRILVLECESRDHRSFESAPRFDARSVAYTLAAAGGMHLTYAGIAPRVEEFVRVGGKLGQMPESSETDPAPNEDTLPVILDIGASRAQQAAGTLPDYTLTAIDDALQAGSSVLLLHNRKGAAVGLFCGACREVIRCRACAGVMAPYSTAGLRCPRCGASASVPAACGRCQNAVFVPFGAGTRRLAEVLREQFPEAKIAVVDGDSEEPVPNDADIVIGTALAAHDVLHMPGVLPRLKVIVLTTFDTMLAEPDMRSAERAWQELTTLQAFAEARGASLIIHTITPEHPLFATLREAPQAFLERESAQRKTRGYPPYGRLVVVTSRQGALDPALTAEARRCLDGIPGTAVIGPIRGSRGIERLIIKTPMLTPALVAWLKTISEAFTLDTDPDISS